MENTGKTIRLPEIECSERRYKGWEDAWVYEFLYQYWNVVRIIIGFFLFSALGFFFIGLGLKTLITIYMLFSAEIGLMSFFMLLILTVFVAGILTKSLLDRQE